MRKKRTWLLGILAAVAVYGLVVLAWPKRPFEDIYDAAEIGKTREDVRDGVRLPPGVYNEVQGPQVGWLTRVGRKHVIKEQGQPFHASGRFAEDGEGLLLDQDRKVVGTELAWVDESNNHQVWMRFDAGGLLVFKGYYYMEPARSRPTLFTQALDWLKASIR